MKIKDIVNSIIQASTRGNYGIISSFEIYKKLEIRSVSNPELTNPLNKGLNINYIREREIPLSGDQEVKGNLFVFSYCGHDEVMLLEECKSLEEAEKSLLSDGGITNPFSTDMVVIENGKEKRYRLFFTDSEDNAEKEFTKKEYWDYCENDYKPKFLNKRIEWV